MENLKVNLSYYDNSWFDSGAGFLKRFVWYIFNVLFLLNPLNPFSCLKVYVLRLFGAKIGRNVVIKPRVNVKYPWNLEVGDYTWIGEKVWIDNLVKVIIGNNVCISQGAMLLCGNHNYKKQTFDLMVGIITLEDGCWVGAQSVVCSGITLYSHSMLGVMSVANRNLESYTIYQGNPAKKVRDRIIV